MALRDLLANMRDCIDEDVLVLWFGQTVKRITEMRSDREKKEWLIDLNKVWDGFDVSEVYDTSPMLRPFLRENFKGRFSQEPGEPNVYEMGVWASKWDCCCEKGKDVPRTEKCPGCNMTYEKNVVEAMKDENRTVLLKTSEFSVGTSFGSSETVQDFAEEWFRSTLSWKFCDCASEECSCDFTDQLGQVVVRDEKGCILPFELPLVALDKNAVLVCTYEGEYPR